MPRRTRIVRENGLHTVCEEAGCPNIGECWEKKHATFMIMGDTCTRACAFCNVKTGLPGALDADEPEHVARGGREARPEPCGHHVGRSRRSRRWRRARISREVIRAIRAATPKTTIEVLTPDFLRKDGAAEIVVAARPDVFNHNLETVPSKYLTVRPGARYFASIRLLQQVKELDPSMFTKSGIMVGLGEERNEVLQLMDDLRAADVDFLTIGQYLQPTRKHHEVVRFVPPDEFKAYETIAYAKGFLMVSASPLTRSSHHAGDDFARLKAARAGKRGLKSCTMRRVLVIGCSGRRQVHVWRASSPRGSACRCITSTGTTGAPAGVERDARAMAREIVGASWSQTPDWVMDGNYSAKRSTCACRVPTRVIWLDYPRTTGALAAS